MASSTERRFLSKGSVWPGSLTTVAEHMTYAMLPHSHSQIAACFIAHHGPCSATQ